MHCEPWAAAASRAGCGNRLVGLGFESLRFQTAHSKNSILMGAQTATRGLIFELQVCSSKEEKKIQKNIKKLRETKHYFFSKLFFSVNDLQINLT